MNIYNYLRYLYDKYCYGLAVESFDEYMRNNRFER
jgi:hypothetical protein